MTNQRFPPIRKLLPVPVNKTAATASSAVTQPVSEIGNTPVNRNDVSQRLMRLKPSNPPYFESIVDPVFEVGDAAKILGISQDLLEKWRQRGRGPAYLQYGKNGPVRYEHSALKAYMELYRIHPAHQLQIR